MRLIRPASAAAAAVVFAAASAAWLVAPTAAHADTSCSLLGGKTSNGTTVTVTGSVDCQTTSDSPGGGGGGGGSVPPCWLAPRFTGKALYDLMHGSGTGGLSNQEYFLAIPHPGQEDQYKDVPPDQGLWWVPVSNGTPEGDACAIALYWPEFAPPPQVGGPTDAPRMSVQQASDMAMKQLKLPPLNITLSPAANTYVNLPTWVYSNPRYPNPVSATATITIPVLGAGSYSVSATITATEQGGLQIQSGSGVSATDGGCGLWGSNSQGKNLTCGVIFTTPTTANQRIPVTVSTTWTITGPGVTTTRTDTDVAYATVREIQTGSNPTPLA
jgi:enoyl reductase